MNNIGTREQEAILLHVNKCKCRIDNIRNYVEADEGVNVEVCTRNIFVLESVVKALEEVQQYRALGTVEELKEAKEKQTPQRPYLWGDGYSDGQLVYDMYDCPNCGKSYEIDEQYDCCPNCGQALDWRNKR